MGWLDKNESMGGDMQPQKSKKNAINRSKRNTNSKQNKTQKISPKNRKKSGE